MVKRIYILAAGVVAAAASPAAAVTPTTTVFVGTGIGPLFHVPLSPRVQQGTHLIKFRGSQVGNAYIEFEYEVEYIYLCPLSRCTSGNDYLASASFSVDNASSGRAVLKTVLPPYGYWGRAWYIKRSRGLFLSYSAADGDSLDYVVTDTFVPQVPEPATWALLGIGFGVIGAAVRRRRGYPAVAG